MQGSPQARSGAAGRSARLLLVLALAACGGEPGARGDAPRAPAESAASGVSGAQNADAGCPPPPAVDTTLFHGTWAAMQAWLQSQNVGFAGGGAAARARVRLATSVSPRVPLVIASERRTHCLSDADLRGQTRIAGTIVVDTATTAWNHAFSAGDSILLFARDTVAVLAFADGDSVATAPVNAWKFFFCRDGHPHHAPKGEWRNFRTAVALAPPGSAPATPGRPGGDDDDDDDGDDPGTYGWMACASGCCQFYIPPNPGQGDPGPGKGKGRENAPAARDTISRPVCMRL